MIFYHKNSSQPRGIDRIRTRRSLLEWSAHTKDLYCFYYNHLDGIDNITFESCIDQQHIEYLRTNKNVKVFYDFCGEPMFVKYQILEIVNVVENWQLNTHQVIIVALDRFQENFLNKILKISQKKSIIKVVVYNLYLDILHLENNKNINSIEKKKFSILCRRHRPWRTYFYSELFDQNLLNCFHFSYHGIDNFQNLTTESIAADVLDHCNKKIVEDFEKFLDGRPYWIDETECYYSCVEVYLCNSDIHVAIEHTEFDEKNLTDIDKSQRYVALLDSATGAVRSVGPENVFDQETENLIRISYDLFDSVCTGKITMTQCKEYSYCDSIDFVSSQEYFISEKIYKPIVLGKPFIVFSDQGYLAALKTLGFATFAPFIDESYDHEMDPAHRIAAIVNEIKRINELAPDQYQTLITECNKIAVHNQMVFDKLKKQNRLEF